jgi:glycogen synthase
MKICIFSRPFHPAVGGLEQIAEILAYEFAAANLSVEVVTDTENLSSDDSEFPFKITRTSSFKERYSSFKRSDVVLFMNFSFAGVPIAMLALKPIVLSHHGIYRAHGSMKTRLTEFAKRQSTRLFPNIAVSDFVARNLPGKSFVVPNAFDDDSFRYKAGQRNSDFVFCGRLVSDKGADVLIDAFRIILDSHPEAKLTIIGDGPELAVLQKQSRAIRVFENLTFTGTLRGQALIDKLGEHSCMVIPSLCEEAFGIVALEGIAACDTVIASNRGGLPEAVGDCGLLVEPTVDQLARAMLAVLQLRKNGEKLPGQPSLIQRAAHLSEHSPKRVAQRYIDVLHMTINRQVIK